MAGDVGPGPDGVLVAQSKTGSLQLVAALTADTASSVDLVATVTLHEVGVIRQQHHWTRLDYRHTHTTHTHTQHECDIGLPDSIGPAGTGNHLFLHNLARHLLYLHLRLQYDRCMIYVQKE